jgi:hypothetical protein
MMDEQAQTILLGEVERQCKFALMAVKDLDDSLKKEDNSRVWYSVQMFLVSVGNLSKMLWKSKAAEKLRSLLCVPDAGSPLESLHFRNLFEHFDERLEKWLSSRTGDKGVGDNFVDSNIGSLRGVDLGPAFVPLRHLSSDGKTLTYLDKEYLLPPVIKAIQELHTRVVAELSRQ